MVELTITTIVTRVFIAFILSTVFGLERQFRKKPVGFGTFTFVCTGSTVLTLLAINISGDGSPLGLLAGIISGIGFLGAGALFRESGRKVHGFTTAASLWAFAALGIAIGAGMVYMGLVFYMLVFVIVLIDSYFEVHSFGPYHKTLTITLEDLDAFKQLSEKLPKTHKVQNFNFNVKNKEYTFYITVDGRREDLAQLPAEIMKIKKVKSFEVD